MGCSLRRLIKVSDAGPSYFALHLPEKEGGRWPVRRVVTPVIPRKIFIRLVCGRNCPRHRVVAFRRSRIKENRMKVSEIMTRDVLLARPGQKLREVAAEM